MNESETRNVLKKITRKQGRLCPELFDGRGEMLPEASAILNDVAQFAAKEVLQAFIGVNWKDSLICGSTAGYLYNQESEIDLVNLWEIDPAVLSSHELEDKLKLINDAMPNRGYSFKLKGRNIRYLNYAEMPGGSGLYSLKTRQWLKKPLDGNFKFTAEELFQRYRDYAENVNTFMRNLPKDAERFLSMDDARKAEDFYNRLKEDALRAERESLDQEYDFNYILYRSFVHTGEEAMLKNYIIGSYAHNLNQVR